MAIFQYYVLRRPTAYLTKNKALGLRRSQNRAFKSEYEKISKYVWGIFCTAFLLCF